MAETAETAETSQIMKCILALVVAGLPAGTAFLSGPRRTHGYSPSPLLSSFVSGETCTGEKVTIVGASGYIGKAVVRESVRRGYSTKAVMRDVTKGAKEPKFEGANLVQADVCNPASLVGSSAFQKGEVDIVISCLASRSGGFSF